MKNSTTYIVWIILLLILAFFGFISVFTIIAFSIAYGIYLILDTMEQTREPTNHTP